MLDVWKIKTVPKSTKPVSRFITNDRISDAVLHLEEGFIYEVLLYAVRADGFPAPIPKYPIGTYQSVYHTSVASLKDISEFQDAIAADKENFDFSGKKLTSMKNIEIPRDVNPLTYYGLIGKLDALIYLDFSNDQFYIIPNACAEFFVSMLVPENKSETIYEDDSYAVCHVVYYEMINENFQDHLKNISFIKQWINCENDDIHFDEYRLYYYVDTYRLNDWMYERLRFAIDPHFIIIELFDVKAESYDDLSVQKAEDDILDYKIVKCRWRLKTNVSGYDYIDWEDSGIWENVNTSIPNQVKTLSTGHGYLKVTKKHFMQLTGIVELNEESEGELVDSTFKQFTKLNGPGITAFSRLQVFLQTRLPGD